MLKPWARANTSHTLTRCSHVYVHYASILSPPNSGLRIREPPNRVEKGYLRFTS